MKKQNNSRAAVAPSLPQSPKMHKKQMYSRQAQYKQESDETTSEVSEETMLQKGFDTGISKQFFENERKKDQERYNRERNL